MVVVDIFGEITVGTEIEVAVMDTLRIWMPTYLEEIELQKGRTRGEIPPPARYTTRNRFDSFPDDAMPLCVVVSPGLAEKPRKEGSGIYSAWWAVGVGFAAVARDADAAGFLSKVYGAASRAILLQHGSLGGSAEGVEWEDESYDDLVDDEERTVRACYEMFRVFKYDIVTKGGGPSDPIAPDPVTQPGSTWPTAETVVIDAINILDS